MVNIWDTDCLCLEMTTKVLDSSYDLGNKGQGKAYSYNAVLDTRADIYDVVLNNFFKI